MQLKPHVPKLRARSKAAHSRLTQAQWKLEQKSQAAPAAGLVFDTFYVPGEFVPAGYPVVSLLPPGNVKISFFVPERELSSISTGQKVWLHVDGSQTTYQADIKYISPQAEYTPLILKGNSFEQILPTSGPSPFFCL